MQYYEALGLEQSGPPRLALDAADLKKRFYERSREWHPDRFGQASRADQERALEMTSVINDAFRTLKDPVTRCEYFLKEHGLDVAKVAPPELLEEVFELNMALEELQEGDEAARPQLLLARDRFVENLSEADRSLAAACEQYDAQPTEAGLDPIRDILNRRKYISNLVRDVEAALA